MAGILPIGKQAPNGESQAAFFWSLKRSELNSWRTLGMTKWLDDVNALWPQAAELIAHQSDADALTFAQYDHFTARRPYSSRLVHIGDAAHATSPQLGQGANMALLDALALAYSLEGIRILRGRCRNTPECGVGMCDRFNGRVRYLRRSINPIARSCHSCVTGLRHRYRECRLAMLSWRAL